MSTAFELHIQRAAVRCVYSVLHPVCGGNTSPAFDPTLAIRAYHQKNEVVEHAQECSKFYCDRIFFAHTSKFYPFFLTTMVIMEEFDSMPQKWPGS